MTHDSTKTIKQRFFDARLPRIKPAAEHGVLVKNLSPHSLKRAVSGFLPPIGRSTISSAAVNNSTLIATNIEAAVSPPPPPPLPITYSSAVHEAAQRFILRNTMAKLSQNSSSAHLTYNFLHRRSTLYNHIQAKIDTGLPRADSKEPPESDAHQLGPIRPVNWSGLKHDIEQDIYIRAHSKRIQFNSGIIYATQLTTLGNLVRSKIKSHLSSVTGSGDERYKIVVNLTIFPTTAGGLHVASRCLWDTHTDNSITIKMQGVDCNILIVAFLCYKDLGMI